MKPIGYKVRLETIKMRHTTIKNILNYIRAKSEDSIRKLSNYYERVIQYVISDSGKFMKMVSTHIIYSSILSFLSI